MANNYPGNFRQNAKVPPQNVEAEESLLGCALTSEEARTEISMLEPEDFYQDKNGLIFAAIMDMLAHGEAIDILSVADYLESKQELDYVGGVSYLTDLADKAYYLSNVRDYAKIIKSKSRLRRLLNFTLKLEEAIYSGKYEADDLLNLMSAEVVNNKTDGSGEGLVAIDDVLNMTLADLKEDENSQNSVDTGFPGLNRMLGNLRNQTLNIIAARPSMGKSSLALNIAANVAARENVVAVFTLEMSKSEVGARLLSSASTTAVPQIKEAINSDEDMETIQKIYSAAAYLVSKNIFVDDSASTSPADIRSKCSRLRAQEGRLDLVIIDYLQLLGADGVSQNRQQEISEITRSLKIMARDLDVPVVALSQLSRNVEMRENKRPLLSDLRESGAIEQDADAVMFLYRDSYYDTENVPSVPDETELIISKNRSGQTGTIKLNWFADYTTFREKEFNDFEAPPESSFDADASTDLPF